MTGREGKTVPFDQAAPGRFEVATPTIAYAGIGDEAGVNLMTQLEALDRLGWNWIELRCVDGTAIADLNDEAFNQLVDALAARGVNVAGVASRIGNWSRPITGAFEQDLDELAILNRRCVTLGTRYIRVMSYLNAGLDEREWGRQAVYRLRELASRAEQADLFLLHENCTGWAGTSAQRMLALLDAVGSPALRLLFDTGNGVAYGYDAYAMLADIVTHVAHVHVKDAAGTPAKPVYTLPGAGQARVADCLRLLVQTGYTGAWSIEPHLTLRPHDCLVINGHQNENGLARFDSFVASGRALEQLVSDQVVPAFATSTAVPGGLVYG